MVKSLLTVLVPSSRIKELEWIICKDPYSSNILECWGLLTMGYKHRLAGENLEQLEFLLTAGRNVKWYKSGKSSGSFSFLPSQY